MIILGMHFGHDGAVSIIKDGEVLSYISRERTSRVKHAIGITTNELDLALVEAQIKVDDIDYCTVVSTQNMEILNGLINDFSISFDKHKDHTILSPLETLFKESNIDDKTGKLKKFFNQGPNNKWENYIKKEIINDVEKKFYNEMKELGYIN